MFHFSPRTYKYLRRCFPNFPTVISIKSWQHFNYIPTGSSNILKDAISEKVKNMTEIEKNCIIMFDEITIHPKLEYNIKQDKIIGILYNIIDIVDVFESIIFHSTFSILKGFDTISNETKLADHVLVLEVKSFFGHWKLPFEYHATSGSMNGKELHKVLIKAINYCHNIGLKIRVIGCDMGGPNQKLFSLLGVTIEKPYFILSMILFSHDYCCVLSLKNIRENLINIFKTI